MKKTSMSAQFTEITLEEMESFLKRGFRSLRPTRDKFGGEYVFNLHITPNIGIKIMTSIQLGRGIGADVGADAIRVLFFHFGYNRPLIRGKAPIVKRTQGWKDNLTDRIEEYIEEYERRSIEWEEKGGG